MEHVILLFMCLLFLAVIITIILLCRRDRSNKALLGWLGCALCSLAVIFIYFLPFHLSLSEQDARISVFVVDGHSGQELDGEEKARFLTILRSAYFRRELFTSKNLLGDEAYYHINIQEDGDRLTTMDLYLSPDGTVRLVRLLPNSRAIDTPW